MERYRRRAAVRHRPVAGAKNSVLKLMAAALLAEGTTVISNCPEILDVPLMADVLRGLGARCRWPATTVSITTPAELSFHADFPAVGRLRASVCVLGPLMGRCRQAAGGPARGRRDRVPAAGHAPVRPARDGRRDEHRARQGGRPGRRLHGASHRPGLPERRRDREHPDGGRPRGRHNGDRQCRPGAGDHRPRRAAGPDGREDRRRRNRHHHHRRGRRAAPDRAPHRRRPGGRRDLGATPPPSPAVRSASRGSTPRS